MKKTRKSQILFLLILLAYCLYAGVYIYRTSFVIEDERYFTLFDDAMVSMRYARNLAGGHGLVWNPGGERVEGYTNSLWVFYMAVFHLLPIARPKISLLIQCSGALFLLINLLFVKKIADSISGNSAFVSLSAVVLTAFYLPLNTWGLQGMEVSALALIVSVVLWAFLGCIRSGEFSRWPYLVLGAGTLVRIDLAVLFLGLLLFLVATDRDNRGRHCAFGFAVLVAFLLLQTGLRRWYYGDIFPNTYYLKIHGYPPLLRIIRGLYVYLRFVWRINWVLFLVPVSLLLYRRNKQILLLLWAFLVQSAYSVYVGGDAWEWWKGGNRYLSIVMPLFFILFCCGVKRAGLYLSNSADGVNVLLGKVVRCGLVVFVIVALINFNEISGPKSFAEWLLLYRPLHVTDNIRNVKMGLFLSEITGDRAKIAVLWAGAIPYFSDRYAIDLLGKNDARIAREKMRVSYGLRKFIAFSPGHLKWNYAYSIGQLKPDVVAEIKHQAEARAYLNRDYRTMEVLGSDVYLLEGSAHVLWEKTGNVQ